MKKVFELFGMSFVVLILALISTIHKRPAEARITGTVPANADIWCVGPDGAEVCVDSSGNFVPTTNNDTSLGSSTLRWSDVQTTDATVADDLTVTDRIIANGQTSLLSRTSTQISALVPDAAGAIIYSSTRSGLCISTGTGAGAWVLTISTSVTASLVICN